MTGVYARIHCMKRISSCKKGREKLFFPHVQSTYISLLLHCPLIRYFEETYKEKEYDMVKLFQRQYFCTRPMCMQLMKNSVVGKQVSSYVQRENDRKIFSEDWYSTRIFRIVLKLFIVLIELNTSKYLRKTKISNVDF